MWNLILGAEFGTSRSMAAMTNGPGFLVETTMQKAVADERYYYAMWSLE